MPRNIVVIILAGLKNKLFEFRVAALVFWNVHFLHYNTIHKNLFISNALGGTLNVTGVAVLSYNNDSIYFWKYRNDYRFNLTTNPLLLLVSVLLILNLKVASLKTKNKDKNNDRENSVGKLIWMSLNKVNKGGFFFSSLSGTHGLSSWARKIIQFSYEIANINLPAYANGSGCFSNDLDSSVCKD